MDNETESALVRKYGAAGVTHGPLTQVCSYCFHEYGHDEDCPEDCPPE
jgi:hypothetical protein